MTALDIKRQLLSTLNSRGMTPLGIGVLSKLIELYFAMNGELSDLTVNRFKSTLPDACKDEFEAVFSMNFVWNEDTQLWHCIDFDSELQAERELKVQLAAKTQADELQRAQEAFAQQQEEKALMEAERLRFEARRVRNQANAKKGWEKRKRMAALANTNEVVCDSNAAECDTDASRNVTRNATGMPSQCDIDVNQCESYDAKNPEKSMAFDAKSLRNECDADTTMHAISHVVASTRASESDLIRSDPISDSFTKKSVSESESESVVVKANVARVYESNAKVQTSSDKQEHPLCSSLIALGFDAKSVSSIADDIRQLSAVGLTEKILRSAVDRVQANKPDDWQISVKYLLSCLKNDLKNPKKTIRKALSMYEYQEPSDEEFEKSSREALELARSMGYTG